MGYINRTDHSERDDSHTNFHVTRSDVEFSIIILGLFALLGLIF